MAWNISNVECTVKVSEAAAKALNEHFGEPMVDDDGLLVFYDGWYEHMDYIEDAMAILTQDRVNGVIVFASTEGDNKNTTWGYRFTDGQVERDNVKLGKTLFAEAKRKAKPKAGSSTVASDTASTAQSDESVSLYYKDGGSDKVYHAQLVKKADNTFDVLFQYGRRGSTLTDGTKVAGVAYDKAKKVYDKLVLEKTGKGYQRQEGAPVTFVQADKTFSGMLPQLLNEIFDDTLEQYIQDDSWWMQQKFDGHNRQMVRGGDQIQSINRKGFIVGMPQETQDALAMLDVHGDWHLAGELVGSLFVVFDVRRWEGNDVAGLPLEERVRILEEVRSASAPCGTLVDVATTATAVSEKRDLFAKMKDGKYEGVVFKKIGSAYIPGRPSSGGNQLKYRFLKNATFRVAGQDDSKRSVYLEVMDNNGTWISKGKVTIPVNYAVPKIGALVDVKYLYAYPGGALAQPRYEGERDDVSVDECLESRLVFKREDEANEE